MSCIGMVNPKSEFVCATLIILMWCGPWTINICIFKELRINMCSKLTEPNALGSVSRNVCDYNSTGDDAAL